MFETMPKATAWLGSRQNMTHAQSCSVSARNRWFLGFPDRGLKLLDNALGLARASDFKTVDDTVRANAMSFFSLVGERERSREHADALVTLATELGNPFRRALGEL